MKNTRRLFLGIDCSTQSMSTIVIDVECAKTVFSESLNYDKFFPQYKTSSGTVVGGSGEVWSFPAMWLDALDKIMLTLSNNIDAAAIAAVSVSAQQHASVWLNSDDFCARDFNKTLVGNFENRFSLNRSPVWLDISTSAECSDITAAVGGAESVLAATGSLETERFTGAQIAKVARKNPSVYAATRRIHLCSSFIASVLAGTDSPIDYGDGAGMNLLDINSFGWNLKMIEATAPHLAEKLPGLAPSDSCAGFISPYFKTKYGFSDDTKVIVGTGDNPSSLVGVGASLASSAAVSLGTSDTFFAAVGAPRPVAGAHVFGNPSGGYMNLICFRNGSLAREKVKDILNVSWDFFDNIAFENYLPSVSDTFCFPFFTDEISPKLKACGLKLEGARTAKLSPAEIVRLTVEGQFMNMKIQSDMMSDKSPESIILTGGASKSAGIAQTVANVFGARVGRLAETENSAALGAAIRAAKGAGAANWQTLNNSFCRLGNIVKPDSQSVAVFAEKLQKFKALRKKIFGC